MYRNGSGRSLYDELIGSKSVFYGILKYTKDVYVFVQVNQNYMSFTGSYPCINPTGSKKTLKQFMLNNHYICISQTPRWYPDIRFDKDTLIPHPDEHLRIRGNILLVRASLLSHLVSSASCSDYDTRLCKHSFTLDDYLQWKEHALKGASSPYPSFMAIQNEMRPIESNRANQSDTKARVHINPRSSQGPGVFIMPGEGIHDLPNPLSRRRRTESNGWLQYLLRGISRRNEYRRGSIRQINQNRPRYNINDENDSDYQPSEGDSSESISSDGSDSEDTRSGS